MHYRPEHELRFLRQLRFYHSNHFSAEKLTHASASSADVHQQQQLSQLRLKWLRTFSLDCWEVPTERLLEFFETATSSRGASHADPLITTYVVTQIRLRIPMEGAPHLKLCQQYMKALPQVTSLDLRDCAATLITCSFLSKGIVGAIALRRLYLPSFSKVKQCTLDRFTQLEELDVTSCKYFANVDFCSATLRVLYADRCDGLTDSGLKRATRLEVLHVDNCAHVTTVAPFAVALLELHMGNNCKLDSKALDSCYRLQVLHARNKNTLSTLQDLPFAERLRELGVNGCPRMGNHQLAGLTSLVKLSAFENPKVTTIAPCANTLVELRSDAVDDEGPRDASQLVVLDVSQNYRLRALPPQLNSTLLELIVSGGSTMSAQEVQPHSVFRCHTEP